MLQEMKAQMVLAMKAKNITERDILRLIISEVQSAEAKQNKTFTSEQIESVIRKLIKDNDESLTFVQPGDERRTKLLEENLILNKLLPTTLSQEEIEVFLLKSDGPEFEQIQNAKNDGQATGIAMKSLKSANQKVLGDDVKAVVAKIRKIE